MKRWLALCLAGVVLALPLCALADIQLTVSTDLNATGLVLMDAQGNSLSTVLGQSANGNLLEWTLLVRTDAADSGTFYSKDPTGNWIRGADMSGLNALGNVSGTGSTGSSAGTGAVSSAVAPTATPPAASSLPPWPQVQNPRISISVHPLPEDERVASKCGPAKTYHGAGAYKTYKMISTQALFTEGSYVLVDLDYTTVGRRIVYFPKSAFSGIGNVPAANLTGVPAYTNASLTPTFGPGYAYDTFDEAAIGNQTPLQVFFEENGWVFAEFSCGLGVVRAWIPVAQVGY